MRSNKRSSEAESRIAGRLITLAHDVNAAGEDLLGRVLDAMTPEQVELLSKAWFRLAAASKQGASGDPPRPLRVVSDN